MRVLASAGLVLIALAAGALLYARHAANPRGYSNADGNRVVQYTLRSRLLRKSLPEIAVVPRGGGPRGLLVFLHGRHDPAPWSWLLPSAPGAFDDAEDYAANDVFAAARSGRYAGLPVWLDGGASDPFHDADRSFVDLLRSEGVRVSYHVWPGAHTHSYWASHMGSYLVFYANALANCRATG